MIDFIRQFATSFPEAIALVLAFTILPLAQYVLNKKQTREIGSNHLGHIEQKLDKMMDILEDMVKYLVKIDTKLNGK